MKIDFTSTRVTLICLVMNIITAMLMARLILFHDLSKRRMFLATIALAVSVFVGILQALAIYVRKD